MKESPEWKFLVIGGGSAGKRQVKTLLSLYPNCEVRHFFEFSAPDPELVEDPRVILWPCQKSLVPPDVSHVFVCSPASMHLRWLKRLQLTNARIFIEKPVCIEADLPAIVELVDGADQKSVV